MKKAILGSLCLIFLVGCGVLDQLMPIVPTELTEEEGVGVEAPLISPLSQGVNGPRKGGSITLSMRNPLSLNPIVNQDVTVDKVLRLLYEPLFEMKGMEAVPVLAQGIEIAQDYGSAIITLRSAFWEDGNAITATDVGHTINVIRNNPESLYYTGIANIRTHQVIDANTLQVEFHAPLGGRLEHALLFPIIPSHTNQPLSSGPFNIAQSTLPRSLTLERNDLALRVPYLQQVQVIITPDLETDLHALNQGTIDLLSSSNGLPYLGVSTVSFDVAAYATHHFDFVAFNFDNIQLSDARVRQAILYAALPHDLMYSAYLGQGQRTSSVVHPASGVYKQGLNYYALDLNRSLALFSESGFFYLGDNTLGTVTAGIQTPLNLRLLVNEENSSRVQVARLLRENLESLGIRVEMLELDFESYQWAIAQRNFDIVLGGVNVYPFWDLRFLLGTGGEQNFMNYASATLDYFLMQAVYASDTQGYREAWYSIQEYLNQEVPLYGIAFRNGVLLTNPVIGGDIDPSISNVFRNIEAWFRTS